jgi:hypothetical protein
MPKQPQSAPSSLQSSDHVLLVAALVKIRRVSLPHCRRSYGLFSSSLMRHSLVTIPALSRCCNHLGSSHTLFPQRPICRIFEGRLPLTTNSQSNVSLRDLLGVQCPSPKQAVTTPILAT